MRLEQVSRHEENSFLLEAETNQAILDNAICKNELCRYLTPLKFIEIDTWRKDVPYGLAQEKDGERRKWKTPHEILSRIAADQNLNTPYIAQDSSQKNEKTSSRNPKRQTLQTLTTQNMNAKIKNMPEKNLNQDGIKYGENYEKMELISNNRHEKEDGKTTDKNKSSRNTSSRRPATSPERQIILTKIRGERILSRPQNSPVTSPKVTTRFQSEKESKIQASYDNFQFPGGFYNRSPLSSVASLRKTSTPSAQPIRPQTTFQDNQESLVTPNCKYMPMEYRHTSNPYTGRAYSAVKSQFYADLTQIKKMTQSAVRPRTRGGETMGFADPLTTILNENTTVCPESVKDPHPPHEKHDKSHTILLDPNIAYIPPQSSRKSNLGFSGDKVRNYYAKAARQQKLAAPSFGNVNAMTTGNPHNENNRTKMQEAVHLPRTSLFSTHQSTSPMNDFSPRVITPNEAHTHRSLSSIATYASHPSPWVSQALPDFTKSEVISKAERDGYYVRKPSKAVSFRLGEGVSDPKAVQRGSRPDVTSTSNNISMVVVNVDEPAESARNLLSRGGAAGIAGKANGFVSGNIIPVRP